MSEKTLTIFVSGDFCPISQADKVLLTKEAELFGGLAEIIKQSDLTVTNLECPLTNSNSIIKKIGPNLKSSPEIAHALKILGFNLVTLANNHIYDYGQNGLEDTIKILDSNEISFVGAGKNLEEARKIFYVEIKGIKLAIVNFAEIEFSCATSKHGGANPLNLIDNIHDIQQARKNADQVIVIVHGGHEHYHYPSPETLKRYRFFAEQGASIVIGHHTHCIGGYEEHKGSPIFYSLGNFFFPMKNMQNTWYQGYALLLSITKQKISYEILPYEQCENNQYNVKLLDKNSGVMKQLAGISSMLADKEYINKQWCDFVIEKKRLSYLIRLSMIGKYPAVILRKLNLLNYFLKKNKLLFMKQYLSCEAHKEAAYQSLESFLDNDKG